jgi:hypothetical protein
MSKKVVKEDLDVKDNGTAAEATLKPNSMPDPMPKSKTQLMADVVAAMGGVDHGDLSKFAESLKMNTGANQSKALDGDQAKSRASITPKGVAADAMKEDVVEMFKGQEGITEELLTKATTLFEAAVNLRVGMEVVRVQEELEAANKTTLEETIKTITEEYEKRVDDYLSYAVKTWAEENQVAIDESIKGRIAIDFMKGMKKLFKEHYVKLPKKKLDVVEHLTAENAELTQKLNDVTKSVVEMTEQLNKSKKHEVVESMSVGLSATQVEKFKTLVEAVDFENEEQFKKASKILKDQYFPKAPKSGKEGLLIEEKDGILVNANGEHVNEKGEVIGEPKAEENLDDEMKLYTETIDRHVKIF